MMPLCLVGPFKANVLFVYGGTDVMHFTFDFIHKTGCTFG